MTKLQLMLTSLTLRLRSSKSREKNNFLGIDKYGNESGLSDSSIFYHLPMSIHFNSLGIL